MGVVENADTGVVPNENFPNTEAPSWEGALKAGVGVADVDGDTVFTLAPKALTVGGLGFANAEVLNMLLLNAKVPEPIVEGPNTDVDMRFANAPKPLEGAATLVFPIGEEARVVDAAAFPNGLDWTCADLCVYEPSASSASSDILVSSSIQYNLRSELRELCSGLGSGIFATHPVDLDSETDMVEDYLVAMGSGGSVDALGSVLILSVLDSSLT